MSETVNAAIVVVYIVAAVVNVDERDWRAAAIAGLFAVANVLIFGGR